MKVKYDKEVDVIYISLGDAAIRSASICLDIITGVLVYAAKIKAAADNPMAVYF